jgi:hypothetical protein
MTREAATLSKQVSTGHALEKSEQQLPGQLLAPHIQLVREQRRLQAQQEQAVDPNEGHFNPSPYTV